MLSQQIQNGSRAALGDTLDSGNPISISVSTESMIPTILPGDLVSVTPYLVEDLDAGDIVLAEDENAWIVHRLLAVREHRGKKHVVLRGDASQLPDPPRPMSSVLGKISGIRRNGRDIHFSNHRPGTTMDDVLAAAASPWSATTNQPKDTTYGFGTEYFLTAAEAEGLSGVIASNIGHATHHDPQLVDGLKKAHLATIARNTVFLAKLDEVINAMPGTDIIVLKGAYLARHVYDDPGLRRFTDIDLLIRRSDFEDVARCLGDAGYSTAERRAPIPGDSRYLNSMLFRGASGAPPLHVHWHLSNSTFPGRARIDIDRIWSESTVVSGNERALAPYHLFLYLCSHAYKHSFDRLVLVRDIAEVLNREARIDWDRVKADAEAFGLERAVYYSLLLVMAAGWIDVDRELLKSFRPPSYGIFDRAFRKFIMSGKRRQNLVTLAHLADAETFRERLRFTGRALCPPKQLMAEICGKPVEQVGIVDYVARTGRGLAHAMRFGR